MLVTIGLTGRTDRHTHTNSFLYSNGRPLSTECFKKTPLARKEKLIHIWNLWDPIHLSNILKLWITYLKLTIGHLVTNF